MSLFKARDWWSTVLGEKEEFDQGCLCLADVDNSGDGQDKIIVGSFMGYLRIFNPHSVKTGDGPQAEDLLLEVHLRDPVLQVEVGKFVSGTEMLHLAVLHSRKLCVYSVSGTLGNVEHGNQYQIKLMYEHHLQRTACNMTYGPFGGVKVLGLQVHCCTNPKWSYNKHLEPDIGVNAEESERQRNKPLEKLLTTTESSGRMEGEILSPRIL